MVLARVLLPPEARVSFCLEFLIYQYFSLLFAICSEHLTVRLYRYIDACLVQILGQD